MKSVYQKQTQIQQGKKKKKKKIGKGRWPKNHVLSFLIKTHHLSSLHIFLMRHIHLMFRECNSDCSGVTAWTQILTEGTYLKNGKSNNCDFCSLHTVLVKYIFIFEVSWQKLIWFRSNDPKSEQMQRTQDRNSRNCQNFDSWWRYII